MIESVCVDVCYLIACIQLSFVQIPKLNADWWKNAVLEDTTQMAFFCLLAYSGEYLLIVYVFMPHIAAFTLGTYYAVSYYLIY